MKMKINTYNYMKGKKIYMIKNIMGAAIAVALAAGVGTTGVRSKANTDRSLCENNNFN